MFIGNSFDFVLNIRSYLFAGDPVINDTDINDVITIKNNNNNDSSKNNNNEVLMINPVNQNNGNGYLIDTNFSSLLNGT